MAKNSVKKRTEGELTCIVIYKVLCFNQYGVHAGLVKQVSRTEERRLPAYMIT